ncbi:unnamed protein product [Discosporangium mesarthrocarpum]
MRGLLEMGGVLWPGGGTGHGIKGGRGDGGALGASAEGISPATEDGSLVTKQGGETHDAGWDCFGGRLGRADAEKLLSPVVQILYRKSAGALYCGLLCLGKAETLSAAFRG